MQPENVQNVQNVLDVLDILDVLNALNVSAVTQIPEILRTMYCQCLGPTFRIVKSPYLYTFP